MSEMKILITAYTGISSNGKGEIHNPGTSLVSVRTFIILSTLICRNNDKIIKTIKVYFLPCLTWVRSIRVVVNVTRSSCRASLVELNEISFSRIHLCIMCFAKIQGSIFWSKTDIYSPPPPPLGNLYFFPKKTA